MWSRFSRNKAKTFLYRSHIRTISHLLSVGHSDLSMLQCYISWTMPDGISWIIANSLKNILKSTQFYLKDNIHSKSPTT